MVISRKSQGGDARTHNLPLTGIYKGIFAQVLAYNQAFVRTYNFRMESKESFINDTPIFWVLTVIPQQEWKTWPG